LGFKDEFATAWKWSEEYASAGIYFEMWKRQSIFSTFAKLFIKKTKIMRKNLLILALLLGSILEANAQKFKGLDKSPMDVAYFPDEFAHDRKFAPQKVGDKAYIRLMYSRPAKKERVVFGKLVPFGKVWRVGADEAPEIKFYEDVTIQGKTLKAGVYSLFMIPTEKEWTIIFNTDLDVWGAYSYNEAKDVLRATVSPKKMDEAVENLTINFGKGNDKEALMNLGWENTMVSLPIMLK
jgi:hypothetical protein